MKIYFEIELRGDDERQYAKIAKGIGDTVAPGLGTGLFSIPPTAWVAEITDTDPQYKFKREFLRYKKDYSRANSVGSRGVYACYILESGKLYDVKDFKNRYYCTVDKYGNVIKLTESEVKECLKSI
jgi:hypothetical protein